MNTFSLTILCIYAIHRGATLTTERLKMRADIAELSKKMDEEEKYQQQKWMRSKFYDSLAYARARRVGIYLGRPDQFDTEEIVRKLQYDQKTIFIPQLLNVFIPKVVKDESIKMVKLNGTSELNVMKLNKYGFKEPNAEDKRPDALDTGGLDLLIIPGAAFTKDRKRLGGQRGFINRYVRRCREIAKNVSVIALAFKHQIVPAIPNWDYPDIRVDKVFSPALIRPAPERWMPEAAKWWNFDPIYTNNTYTKETRYNNGLD